MRGRTYLKDRKKVPAGLPAFRLGAVEMVVLPPPGTAVGDEGGDGAGAVVSGGGRRGGGSGTPGVLQHVGRFVPSVRRSGAPFSIIINLVSHMRRLCEPHAPLV